MSESPSSLFPRALLIAGVVVLLVLGGIMVQRGGDETSEGPGADVAVPDPATAGSVPPATGPTGAAPTAPASDASATAAADGSGGEGVGSEGGGGYPVMGSSQSEEDEPLDLPDIPWEALPETHHAEEFEASVESLSDWIVEIDPKYDAQLLGTDCSAPPCLVGMAFDGTSFGDDHTAKAGFQTGFSEELQRLRGQRPSMTMVTATPDGTTAVWMYELPAGIDDAEAVHEDLNKSAQVRHQQWIAAWSSARAGR